MLCGKVGGALSRSWRLHGHRHPIPRSSSCGIDIAPLHHEQRSHSRALGIILPLTPASCKSMGVAVPLLLLLLGVRHMSRKRSGLPVRGRAIEGRILRGVGVLLVLVLG